MLTFNISNGTIQDISFERDTSFVTVSYRDEQSSQGNEQTIRLVVRPRTVILNPNGIPVPATTLRIGMIINASVSSAMTRSIPPQAEAYFVEIVRGGAGSSTTVGRIVDIDRNNRSFMTISDGDFTSVIRFNVPQNTPITNRMGRSMEFSGLVPGMRVEVRNANFMTASIPPQTTALEIKVL